MAHEWKEIRETNDFLLRFLSDTITDAGSNLDPNWPELPGYNNLELWWTFSIGNPIAMRVEINNDYYAGTTTDIEYFELVDSEA